MDCKKKYDEALERAIVAYKDEDKHLKATLERIFPELAESEDEKARKAIMALIEWSKSYSASGITNDDAKKMLAWLEKQGGYSIKWNKNTEDNKPQVNHSILMQTTHGVAEGEWQGEEWFQLRWSSRLKDSSVLYWAELSDIENQGSNPPVLSNSANNGKDETKPEENKGNIGGISPNSEWSEEDEWKFSDILALLRGGENCHYNTPDLFDWLKTLKDRVQPKQEWSEEDNLYYDDICEILINFLHSEKAKVNKEAIQKDLDWITSIKKRMEMKQEWSEKDKDYYDAIIAKLEVTQEDAALTNNQMDFLKSLRPQKCLIPSEEEIEKAAKEWDSKANFNPFYMTMEGGKPTGVKQSITTHEESFKAGVNWILKFLKPQNAWKPSDEQMMAL